MPGVERFAKSRTRSRFEVVTVPLESGAGDALTELMDTPDADAYAIQGIATYIDHMDPSAKPMLVVLRTRGEQVPE